MSAGKDDGLTKNYLIYQAHTSHILYYETVCSIYSCGLQNDFNRITILIYTDNPDFFEPYLKHLKVIYRKIDKKLIDEWMGPHAFIHRMKIKVLQEIISRYHGNFLYVDSDTYFTNNIDELFSNIAKGTLYMHCFENLLYNIRMYKRLNGYVVKLNGENHIIARDTPIWNAGALGFNNDAADILNQVLDLTDVLYEYYQKHIIEQFSFSYLFNRIGSIQKAEPHIFHYWFVKEFRMYLKEIFANPLNQNVDTLTNVIRAVNPTKFAEEKLKWRSHSGLYRAYKRMIGHDFKLPPLPEILTQA